MSTSSAWRLRDRVRTQLKPGECISLPLPLIEENKLVTVFLIFTVNLRTSVPNPPKAICRISDEAVSRVDYPTCFEKLASSKKPSTFVNIADFSRRHDEAFEAYGLFIDEFSSSRTRNTLAYYLSLIEPLTQPDIYPYALSVCPLLSQYNQAR